MKRRGSWLATLLAFVAILYGFGSFTAALACPTSFEVSGGSTEETPCVQPCSQICQAIPPSSLEPTLKIHLTDIPNQLRVDLAEGMNSGPEPPPPRMAELELA